MRAIANAMRQIGQQQQSARAGTRVGVITNYDPATYSVKVRIQPDDILSGWIPLKAVAVGDGFGIYAAPRPGDVVELHFQEDAIDCASAGLRFFGDGALPVKVPAGEYWIVHRSGSTLKFHDSGDVELVAAGSLSAAVTGSVTATVAGSLNATVSGDATFAIAGSLTSSAAAWTHTGAMNLIGLLSVTGAIRASTSITDTYPTNTKTMGDMRTVFNTHTHAENGTTTSTPTPTI